MATAYVEEQIVTSRITILARKHIMIYVAERQVVFVIIELLEII